MGRRGCTERFMQSEMIWSLKGAKALLPLRTLHKSNRLEEFFAYLVRGLRQVDCASGASLVVRALASGKALPCL